MCLMYKNQFFTNYRLPKVTQSTQASLRLHKCHSVYASVTQSTKRHFILVSFLISPISIFFNFIESKFSGMLNI